VLVAVAAGLAGCTATPGRTDEDPPGDQPTDSDGPTPTGDDCTSGFHVALKAFAPSDDLAVHVEGATERDLVATAVESGSATHETYGESPLRAGVVEHEEAYYQLAVEEAGSETVPAFLFDISWENGRTAPDGSTLLAFEDLPEPDREAIRFLVPDGEGEEDEGHPSQSFTGRERPVPYPAGGDDSRLLEQDTVWVRYDGREYRVSTGAETTTELHRYRYTADEVAADRAALRTWAAETYLLDPSFSEAERDLLRQAGSDYYEECSPPSEALAGIQSKLPEDARLPAPAEGWYVDVDDDRHRLEILKWVE
jgi:hypothetical protein